MEQKSTFDTENAPKKDNKGIIRTVVFGLLVIGYSLAYLLIYQFGIFNSAGMDKAECSDEEAIAIVQDAGVIRLKGILKKSWFNDNYICVDNKYYGKRDRKSNYHIGDSIVCRIDYEPIGEHWSVELGDNFTTATTYNVYDADGNVIGHFQETALKNDMYSEGYYFFYYDENDQLGEYYFHSDTGRLINISTGMDAATVYHNEDGNSSYSVYVVRQQNDVPLVYELFMCEYEKNHVKDIYK